ncbi:hypothetical protein MAR_010356 [Mya arenaria]|uniref:Uncharacterized protein n=1 Tax=Mya arenaria TaxID=6604 RepID=A0ABY7E1C8_MYAAR|nr:hypothetical protein MAR_010356 [Mya arenaria]
MRDRRVLPWSLMVIWVWAVLLSGRAIAGISADPDTVSPEAGRCLELRLLSEEGRLKQVLRRRKTALPLAGRDPPGLIRHEAAVSSPDHIHSPSLQFCLPDHKFDRMYALGQLAVGRNGERESPVPVRHLRTHSKQLKHVNVLENYKTHIRGVYLSEDEGNNICGLPEAGVEQWWEGTHGERMQNFRAVEHVVQALVSPPFTAHCSTNIQTWILQYVAMNHGYVFRNNCYNKDKLLTEMLTQVNHHSAGITTPRQIPLAMIENVLPNWALLYSWLHVLVTLACRCSNTSSSEPILAIPHWELVVTCDLDGRDLSEDVVEEGLNTEGGGVACMEQVSVSKFVNNESGAGENSDGTDVAGIPSSWRATCATRGKRPSFFFHHASGVASSSEVLQEVFTL